MFFIRCIFVPNEDMCTGDKDFGNRVQARVLEIQKAILPRYQALQDLSPFAVGRSNISEINVQNALLIRLLPDVRPPLTSLLGVHCRHRLRGIKDVLQRYCSKYPKYYQSGNRIIEIATPGFESITLSYDTAEPPVIVSPADFPWAVFLANPLEVSQFQPDCVFPPKVDPKSGVMTPFCGREHGVNEYSLHSLMVPTPPIFVFDISELPVEASKFFILPALTDSINELISVPELPN